MGSEVRSNDGSESVADSGELPTPARHAAPQLVPHLNEHGEEVEALIAGLDTISLKSSITRYREELGRTYHAYGSTEHWGPNDEKAQDQQDLTHHLWTLALKGEYFVAPISDPKWILDLGTGTGIWAIEVAERYPDAEVKGIDVSPIQPLWVPPNLTFEVDDYNREWMDEGVYDLIHARELLGTVPDWVALYRKAYSALKPGGWFDQAEPTADIKSKNGELDENHPYRMWYQLITEAGNKVGMTFNVAPYMKGWLEEAGFINVKEYRVPWTVGGWSKDRHQREVGQWNQVRLDTGVKDFCSRRFTNQMGWKPEEIEVFCAQMRAAFRDRKLLGYQFIYFVCGQRPP